VPFTLYHAHPWDVSNEQARNIQMRLASLVNERPPNSTIRTVAGVDVSYPEARWARAGAAVMSFPDLVLVETATAVLPVCFPHVPGLLSFREAPVAIQALGNLRALPHILLCDAHGRAHPRRLGTASHLGLLLDLPTIGCAKSWLIGPALVPAPERGSATWLFENGQIIGSALRTQPNAKPVYVSVGHRIDLPAAVSIVLQCTRRHRLPEPLSRAHALATDRQPAKQDTA
jgi:deoxyribonuclease V